MYVSTVSLWINWLLYAPIRASHFFRNQPFFFYQTLFKKGKWVKKFLKPNFATLYRAPQNKSHIRPYAVKLTTIADILYFEIWKMSWLNNATLSLLPWDVLKQHNVLACLVCEYIVSSILALIRIKTLKSPFIVLFL